MIDIHSHIVFSVDDGSKSLEQSIKYLNEIKSIGMSNVICTPHVKHGEASKLEKIIKHFNILKEEANKLGINLYLGNEIMYTEKTIDLLNNHQLLTLNGTKYILVEFKRDDQRDDDDIISIFERLIEAGYKPIWAHPELYAFHRDIELVRKVRSLGVIIQIDSTSLLPNEYFNIYLYAHKLLKNYLVDMVASDSHCSKKRSFKTMAKAYKHVKRKYGDYASIIFGENQKNIIGG